MASKSLGGPPLPANIAFAKNFAPPPVFLSRPPPPPVASSLRAPVPPPLPPPRPICEPKAEQPKSVSVQIMGQLGQYRFEASDAQQLTPIVTTLLDAEARQINFQHLQVMHQMEMQKQMMMTMMMVNQGVESSEPVPEISQNSPSKRLKPMPSDPNRGDFHPHANFMSGPVDRASQEHEYYGDKVISVYGSYENTSQSLLQCQILDEQVQEIAHPEFPHLFVHPIVARFMCSTLFEHKLELQAIDWTQVYTLFGQRAGQDLFAATGRLKNALELGRVVESQQRYIPSHKYFDPIQYLQGPGLDTASVCFAEYLLKCQNIAL
eukprot:s466_g12.t1